MAATEEFMNAAMTNPDVLIGGALAGFVIGYMMAKRRRRGMGMGGGF